MVIDHHAAIHRVKKLPCASSIILTCCNLASAISISVSVVRCSEYPVMTSFFSRVVYSKHFLCDVCIPYWLTEPPMSLSVLIYSCKVSPSLMYITRSCLKLALLWLFFYPKNPAFRHHLALFSTWMRGSLREQIRENIFCLCLYVTWGPRLGKRTHEIERAVCVMVMFLSIVSWTSKTPLSHRLWKTFSTIPLCVPTALTILLGAKRLRIIFISWWSTMLRFKLALFIHEEDSKSHWFSLHSLFTDL